MTVCTEVLVADAAFNFAASGAFRSMIGTFHA